MNTIQGSSPNGSLVRGILQSPTSIDAGVVTYVARENGASFCTQVSFSRLTGGVSRVCDGGGGGGSADDARGLVGVAIDAGRLDLS